MSPIVSVRGHSICRHDSQLCTPHNVDAHVPPVYRTPQAAALAPFAACIRSFATALPHTSPRPPHKPMVGPLLPHFAFFLPLSRPSWSFSIATPQVQKQRENLTPHRTYCSRNSLAPSGFEQETSHNEPPSSSGLHERNPERAPWR